MLNEIFCIHKKNILFSLPTYKIDMCPLACKKHMLFNSMCFSYAFLKALIKKICASHMFKGDLLIVNCQQVKDPKERRDY
jgi:hypothetical protein